MRILLMSDSHGNDINVEKVMRKARPFDMVLHMGDVEGSDDYIAALAECETHIVRGNCDFFSDLPAFVCVEAGGHKIYLRHGNGYVNYDPKKLLELTDADIVLFGHTHVPFYQYVEGRHLFNPGSISYPRQKDKKATYGVLEIDENGGVHFATNYVN